MGDNLSEINEKQLVVMAKDLIESLKTTLWRRELNKSTVSTKLSDLQLSVYTPYKLGSGKPNKTISSCPSNPPFAHNGRRRKRRRKMESLEAKVSGLLFEIVSVSNFALRRTLGKFKRTLLDNQKFKRDFGVFAELSRRSGSLMPDWSERYPCLEDATAQTGFDGHYIYHTAWAARILAQMRPEKHVDISSSLYFCGLVSAFVPVDFYDYRPAPLHLSRLQCQSADLNALPFESQSLTSVSCMHVVEHIGLGRYGDTLDPLGDLNAMRELQRVVAPGGSLLFVTPVGKPTIRFNAHRIYDPQTIIERFSELSLREFALVPDDFMNQGFLNGASFEKAREQEYGCGCFWFEREA